MALKILLIEDHSLFRDGMHLALSGMNDEVQVFNASSYEEALPLMGENPDMDLVLLDLGLPGLNDTHALQAIRNEFPATPVVVVTGNADGSKIHQILSMGAQGYIPKSTSTALLVRALKLVLSGGIYIPPEILSQQNMENHAENTATSAIPSLTPRQFDVLKKLACGMSNKEISVRLDMAEPTVRAHVAAIFKALNTTNRTQAAHIALTNGWISVDPET